MTEATKRSIVRWIHLICAIPIIGYIYSPFANLPDYATPTRFVFFPVMLLSGLWLWKGQLVRRLVSRAAA
jgi:thiosulfate reductase cytochrome b subunit